jgi:hypothetical protein
MIDLEPFGDPPSEREVRRVEKRIGNLPPRYREYLLRSNGGKSGEDCKVEFQLADESESVMLGLLYGISSNRPGVDLLASYESEADDLPKEFLPIGEDPGGNLLLVRVEGKERDAIYFWDCRTEIFLKRYGRNVFRVADNIDDFLSSLRPCV